MMGFLNQNKTKELIDPLGLPVPDGPMTREGLSAVRKALAEKGVREMLVMRERLDGLLNDELRETQECIELDRLMLSLQAHLTDTLNAFNDPARPADPTQP